MNLEFTIYTDDICIYFTFYFLRGEERQFPKHDVRTHLLLQHESAIAPSLQH